MTKEQVMQLQHEMYNRAHQFTKALAALWLVLYKGNRDKEAVKQTLLQRIAEQRKFLDDLENELKEI